MKTKKNITKRNITKRNITKGNIKNRKLKKTLKQRGGDSEAFDTAIEFIEKEIFKEKIIQVKKEKNDPNNDKDEYEDVKVTDFNNSKLQIRKYKEAFEAVLNPLNISELKELKKDYPYSEYPYLFNIINAKLKQLSSEQQLNLNPSKKNLKSNFKTQLNNQLKKKTDFEEELDRLNITDLYKLKEKYKLSSHPLIISIITNKIKEYEDQEDEESRPEELNNGALNNLFEQLKTKYPEYYNINSSSNRNLPVNRENSSRSGNSSRSENSSVNNNNNVFPSENRQIIVSEPLSNMSVLPVGKHKRVFVPANPPTSAQKQALLEQALMKKDKPIHPFTFFPSSNRPSNAQKQKLLEQALMQMGTSTTQPRQSRRPTKEEQEYLLSQQRIY